MPQTLPLLMHVMASQGLSLEAAEIVRQLKLAERVLVAYLPLPRLVDTGLITPANNKMWLRSRQDYVYNRSVANLAQESPRGITQLLYTFLDAADSPQEPVTAETVRQIVAEGKIDVVRVFSLLVEVVGALPNPEPIRTLLDQIMETVSGPTPLLQAIQMVLMSTNWHCGASAAAVFAKWQVLDFEQALGLFPDPEELRESWRPAAEPTQIGTFILRCLELDLEEKAMPVLRQFPFIAQLEPRISLFLGKRLADVLNNETFDFEAAQEYLALMGPLLGQTPQLLVQLSEHAKQPRDDWVPFWTRLLGVVVLPALSLVKDSPEAVESVWSILEQLPFRNRYDLYSEWRARSKADRTLAHAFAAATREAKAALKRLSKTNADTIMPRLAKVAYYNPLAAFEAILVQLESYDFLRRLVAEHASMFNRLDWDVLSLVLMERLAMPRTSRHENGMLDRQWLLSLAELSAQLALQFTEFDVRPLIQYVLKRLEACESDTQLVVLRQLLARMGGQPVVKNASCRQLEALAGPEPLRLQVLAQLGKECSEPPVPQRLLNSIESLGVVDRLFYALAGALSRAQNPGLDATPIVKVMSYTIDEISQTMGQYLGLLTAENCDELRSLHDLATDMPLPLAFAARRKALNRQVYMSGPATDEAIEPALKEYADLAGDIPAGLFLSFWVMGPYEVFYSPEVYAEHMTSVPESENEMKQAQLRHRLHVTRWTTSLKQQSAHWFEESNAGEYAENILLECFLPRMRLSPLDAWYTVQFFERLFSLSAPNWSTLAMLDALFSYAPFEALGLATGYESDSISVFYRELLRCLNNWARSDDSFSAAMQLEPEGESESDADGEVSPKYNGSMREYEPFGGRTDLTISLDDFRESLGEWHTSLTAMVVTLLRTEEPVTQRNAISLCFNSIGEYPLLKSHGHALLVEMNRLYTTSTSEDIRLAARSLLGLLYKRRDSWQHTVEEYFEVVDVESPPEETPKAQETPEAEEGAQDDRQSQNVDKETVDAAVKTQRPGRSNYWSDMRRERKLRQQQQQQQTEKRHPDRQEARGQREREMDRLPQRPDSRADSEAPGGREGRRRNWQHNRRDRNRDNRENQDRSQNQNQNQDRNQDRGQDQDRQKRKRDQDQSQGQKRDQNSDRRDRRNGRNGNRWRDRKRDRPDGDRQEQDSKRRRQDDRGYR